MKELPPSLEERPDPNGGAQRLSLAKLQEWESLKLGMFIHFGMSTFDRDDHSMGDQPATLYAPDKLDVAQWVSTARDAGMKYAILTTKHTAGHCLWPTDLTDYSVKNSGNTTDVVQVFCDECRKKGVKPGLYYCSWDNHNTFGSITPGMADARKRAFVTTEYMDFQTRQIEELLTRYGDIFEVWVDSPWVLPRAYRNDLYAHIAKLQPETFILMNHGITDGREMETEDIWPSDLLSIERYPPPSPEGHIRWRPVEGKSYYVPGEVCDLLSPNWFHEPNDPTRPDLEVLAMTLLANTRNANMLLNVPPDKHGLIPQNFVDGLMTLRRNLDRL